MLISEARKMISDAVINYNSALNEWEKVNHTSYVAGRTQALVKYCKAKAWLEGMVDMFNTIQDDYIVILTFRSLYEFDQPIDKVEILKVKHHNWSDIMRGDEI